MYLMRIKDLFSSITCELLMVVKTRTAMSRHKAISIFGIVALVVTSLFFYSNFFNIVTAQNDCEAQVEFICNPDPNRFNLCAEGSPLAYCHRGEATSDTGSDQQPTGANQQIESPYKGVLIEDVNLAFSYPSDWQVERSSDPNWVNLYPEGTDGQIFVGIGGMKVDVQSLSPAILENTVRLAIGNKSIGGVDPNLRIIETKEIPDTGYDKYLDIKATTIDATGTNVNIQFKFGLAGDILYSLEYWAPESRWGDYIPIFDDFTKRAKFGGPVSNAQNIIDEQSEINEAILEYQKNTMINNMRMCAFESMMYFNVNC